MRKPDDLQSGSGVSIKKIELFLGAASVAVVALMWSIAIGVSKVFVGEDQKYPAATGNPGGGDDPKLVDPKAKQPAGNPPLSAETPGRLTYDSLVENPSHEVFKEPETLEEACDALRDGDPAYYTVGKALKLVRDAKIPLMSSPYSLPKLSVTTDDLGIIGATCSLNGEDIMRILKDGVEQGDVEAGKLVMDMMEDRCDAEDSVDLDHKIMFGQFNVDLEKKCGKLASSPYYECLQKDSVTAKAALCSRVEDEFAFQDCYAEATKECEGLDIDSPRSECERTMGEEFDKKARNLSDACVADKMRENGIDPEEVKPLAEIKDAKFFVESYLPLEEWGSNDGPPSSYDYYFWQLQDLNIENPEVLEVLGVDSRQAFIDKYVTPFLDSMKNNLQQSGDLADGDAIYSSMLIEEVEEKYGL